MLVIKLSKVGKTNKKMFRLIISEKSRDPYGNVLEILGSYNPYSKELSAQAERIKYWLSQGAQMTPTVNNLLVGQKMIEGKKVVASKPGKQNEKRISQQKAKAEKRAAAEKPAAQESPSEEKSEEAPAEAQEIKEEKTPEGGEKSTE